MLQLALDTYWKSCRKQREVHCRCRCHGFRTGPCSYCLHTSWETWFWGRLPQGVHRRYVTQLDTSGLESLWHLQLDTGSPYAYPSNSSYWQAGGTDTQRNVSMMMAALWVHHSKSSPNVDKLGKTNTHRHISQSHIHAYSFHKKTKNLGLKNKEQSQ